MPLKPGKYGIKLWLICDSRTSYAFMCIIYTGRPIGGERQRNVGENVVLSLIRPIDDATLHGRNVVTDRFFTSFNLSISLLEKNMTLVGTCNTNRTFVPRYLGQTREEVGSTVYCYNNQKTLLSYQDKPAQTPVVLLSTMHLDPREENGVPEIVHHYNQHKCGVDLADMMCASYTTRRKSRRWPFVLFCNMLDMMALNAFIIWRLKNMRPAAVSAYQRRLFLQDLAVDLAAPHMQRRLRAPQTSKVARKCIAVILQDRQPAANQPAPIPRAHKGRCFLCDRGQDRKVATTCSTCDQHVCPVHSNKDVTVTCNDCI